jgi:hypothetical protein
VLNQNGLEGDVVVARDLGERNGLLLRRLSHHKPFLMSWDGEDAHSAMLTPLPAHRVDLLRKPVMTAGDRSSDH